MNNKGFTLIETLIYIALIGVVVSGFVAFTLTISNARNKNYVVQEVQANARIALNLITQKILASNGVNIGSSVFDSHPGVLSLSMAQTEANPLIINLGDDGQLQIKEGTSDEITITSDEIKITNLIFTDLTSTSRRANIRIQITVEYNNKGTDKSFDYFQELQTAVSIRQ